jgi:hypothetical protein
VNNEGSFLEEPAKDSELLCGGGDTKWVTAPPLGQSCGKVRKWQKRRERALRHKDQNPDAHPLHRRLKRKSVSLLSFEERNQKTCAIASPARPHGGLANDQLQALTRSGGQPTAPEEQAGVPRDSDGGMKCARQGRFASSESQSGGCFSPHPLNESATHRVVDQRLHGPGLLRLCATPFRFSSIAPEIERRCG